MKDANRSEKKIWANSKWHFFDNRTKEVKGKKIDNDKRICAIDSHILVMIFFLKRVAKEVSFHVDDKNSKTTQNLCSSFVAVVSSSFCVCEQMQSSVTLESNTISIRICRSHARITQLPDIASNDWCSAHAKNWKYTLNAKTSENIQKKHLS